MNNFKKYSASILLIFALFAINGAEFLHHHDHLNVNDESKCEACIFSHSLNTALTEHAYSFTAQVQTFQSISSSVQPVYAADLYSSSHGRAPPAASHI